MTPRVVMALLTGLLVAADTPPIAPKKVQSLMGQWVVVSVEAPEIAAKTAQQFESAELTFAFDPQVRATMLTITKNEGEKTERVDVWRIEAQQTDKGPHTLNLIGDQVGEGGLRRQKMYERLGIYEMSGNDLKICLATECVVYDLNGPVTTDTNRHLVRTFDPKLGILLTLRRAPKVTTGPAPAAGTRDLHFQRGVPASDLKFELTPAAKATRRPKAIFLPVKLTNSSSDEISTTLAHEWHGGLWPPTGLYASVTPAEQTTAAAFEPVYLAGENPEMTEATILAPGKSKELMLRMDWRGTGSVPARRLMESAGTYNVRLLLVCEVSGKQQYVISPTATVELPDVKPIGPKREPWAGEPVIPLEWVRGGKLSTFKRLPRASEVTAVRISGELNRTNRPLTAANFASVLDSMRPVQADEPKYKDISYAPWCSADFETREGPFRLTLYIGGLALIDAPDGSVGLVTFDWPVEPSAAPVTADERTNIEDGLGHRRFRFDKANVVPKDDPIYPVLAQYLALMRKREEADKQIRSTFYDWIRVDSPAAAQLFPRVRFASLRWDMHAHPEHKGPLSLAQGLEMVVAIDTTTNRLIRELGVHGNHEEFSKLLTDYQVTLRDAKKAQLVWDASCEVYGQGSKTEPLKQTSASQWQLGISSYDQTTSEVDGVKTVVTKTHYTGVLVDPKTHQITSWKAEVESSNERKVPAK